MNDSPTKPDVIQQDRRSRRPRWFTIALVLLLISFSLVIIERNRIRAHWWAHQLARTEDLNEQGYYLNSIIAVGEEAAGAIQTLIHHDDSNVRALAVVALQSLPERTASHGLVLLLSDENVDVRESAALAIAFMQSRKAATYLYLTTQSDQAGPASASVMALSRLRSKISLKGLCQALEEHPSPIVRAQAAESLAEWVEGAPEELLVQEGNHSERQLRDPFQALSRALRDQATFSGDLSLEREIRAAVTFARQQNLVHQDDANTESVRERTVAEIAANTLSKLTGQTVRPLFESPPGTAANLAEQYRGMFFGRRNQTPRRTIAAEQEN
ncbi:MAG: HEAT repeat domain-containing protein [Phycisphaerales bacterium]|nr:HEAT repeat domain-containing protein [Phycisphaerales bacterium]